MRRLARAKSRLTTQALAAWRSTSMAMLMEYQDYKLTDEERETRNTHRGEAEAFRERIARPLHIWLLLYSLRAKYMAEIWL